MKTAVIIGGGFVGCASAWQLQRAGFATTLVDTGDFERAASWGNAGHLAIEQIDPLASRANVLSLPRRLFTVGGPVGFPLRDIAAWLPFGLKLLAASAPDRFTRGQTALAGLLAQAMPAWNRLATQTQISQHLRADGHFVAWESVESAAKAKRNWLNTNIGQARVFAATNDELHTLRQHFNQRPVDAVRFEHTGQILDLAAARIGIAAALRNAGGTTRIADARSLAIANGKASVQFTDGSTLKPDLLLIASGAQSANLLRATEGTVPLIAERGYHVQSEIAETSHQLPPVAFEDRSVIVTRFANTLRIAGFTEFSRVESPSDERKWNALSRHAAALGLPFNTQATRWIGARPTLPDYLPAIGRSRTASNLMYAFGHQHLGLTLCAITGELVAALATAAPSAVELTPFDLKRFQ